MYILENTECILHHVINIRICQKLVCEGEKMHKRIYTHKACFHNYVQTFCDDRVGQKNLFGIGKLDYKCQYIGRMVCH